MKRFSGLVFFLSVGLLSFDAAANCPDAVSIFGFCVACGAPNSSGGYISVGTDCDFCGATCTPMSPTKDAASQSMCNGDASWLKAELGRRLQYVIDVDARTLNQVAEINPMAAVWLARQSPALSQIAKGNEVNIEDGNSYSAFISTIDTLKLMAAGIGDDDLATLGPTLTPAPSGQMVYAKYTSTRQSDGTIQVRFESSLVIAQDKTTVSPLYQPVTFVLGPSSRELAIPVPGRPDENLRAYPVVNWAVQTTPPHVFRMQE